MKWIFHNRLYFRCIIIANAFVLMLFVLFMVIVFIRKKSISMMNEYETTYVQYENIFNEYVNLNQTYRSILHDKEQIVYNIESINSNIINIKSQIEFKENEINEFKKKVPIDDYNEFVSIENDYIKLYHQYEQIKMDLYKELTIYNSLILSSIDDIKFIYSNLNVHSDSEVNIRLCYSSKIDGISSKYFHQRCDNVYPTLTLYKTSKAIFGGFTHATWENIEDAIFKKDPNAFLFNLYTHQIYYLSSQNNNAIMTGEMYLPSFGELDFAMTDKSAFTKFPKAYTSKQYSPVKYELTNYDQDLYILSIEVYEVLFK